MASKNASAAYQKHLAAQIEAENALINTNVSLT